MELVFVPTPAMGHILSSVEAAKRILHGDERISIAILICNVPTISSKITAFLDSKSQHNPYPTRLSFLTLPPPTNPPDPSSPDFFQAIFEIHKPLVKQAVEARRLPLAGFIIDMFFTTMMDVANDFKVPSYIFFTSGAHFLAFLFHSQSLADHHGFDVATKFNDPDAQFQVPGFVNPVTRNAIPHVFMDNRETGTKSVLNLSRRLRTAKGIIINTFKELNCCSVEALHDLVAKGNIPAIYPVGPILELEDDSKGESQNSIIEWLDNQPSSSVVFVCFGSVGVVDEDQVKEIAKGLENSEHRFLWSLRKPLPKGTYGLPSDEAFVDALPDGFLERTSERGRVIGWAPQVSILAHSAVGGFVSHCGWNSILESLWFGVPIAAWPIAAEQNLNAFVLVKELGLAVELRMDYQRDWITKKSNVLVSAQEIENGVTKLMSMDQENKIRIHQIRDKSRKTLEEGGSSFECLGRFIQDVWNNFP